MNGVRNRWRHGRWAGLVLAGLAGCGGIPATPPPDEAAPTRWRTAELRLPLDGRPPLGRPEVVFPGVEAARTVVRLDAIAGQRLTVTGRCDGTVRPRDAGGSLPDAGPGTPFTVQIGPAMRDGSALTLHATVQACDLEVRAEDGRAHSLRLVRDEVARPALAALDTRRDVCALPPAATLDPLARVALAAPGLSRSCPGPLGPTRLLTDETAAFNARVEALMGRPLPAAALAAADPEMALDFSAAPVLDLIVVAALQLRADFSGRLLGRMLAHHAARGTTVRILVSENLMTGPDRRMLARLAADWPAVEVQALRWTPPPGAGTGGWIDRIQRSQHTKMFGVLGPDPGSARMIVGGRNIHDGFLFDRPPAPSGQPGLHDYTSLWRPPLAYFAAYEDLELEIADPPAVRAMLAHMATLWHRDGPGTAIRPFARTIERADAPRTGGFHFLSVPADDDRALEHWLVALIDAAERTVDIASPYLNPTAPVAAALDRALARGVRLRVVAPRPTGDPLDGFKAVLKRDFLARFGDRAEVWELAQTGRLLHSKFLIFDGRLSLITSANFNARSLLHDTENGIAVLDAGFARRLEAVQESYVARADRVGPPTTPPRPTEALRGLLLRSETVRGWF
ncbi:MAG: phospholipase D-like domain-containing protein [Alkalilacustris sp.]